MRYTLSLTLLGAAGSLAAQGSDSPAGDVTFTEHVAPIVFEKCAPCHRPGEVAPFPLLTYRDVRKRGRMIARVTRRRLMPPWPPVPGHGEFADSLYLEDEQIDVIRRWVGGGMPEGPAEALPALPEFTEGWQLGEPDLIVRMPEGFELPAAGPDIYRYFEIPLDLDETKWVTAMEVRPSARAVLHHTITFLDDSGQVRMEEDADGAPGSSNVAMTGSRSLGGWAVGSIPRHLPDGFAYTLRADDRLFLQSHFHLSGKPEVEQTTLGLYFTDRAPTSQLVWVELLPASGMFVDLSVPAGEADYAIEDSFTLPVDVRVFSVEGHAHMICREMQATVTPPGEAEESVFLVDDWDFNWQSQYQYREPLWLPAGTRIDVRLVYDNSSDNPDNPNDPPIRINWGPESTDEMGRILFAVAAATDADTDRLRAGLDAYRVEHFAKYRQLRIERLRSYDGDGDGRTMLSEIPEHELRWARRWDADGDQAIDWRDLVALRPIMRLRRGGRGR